MRKCDFPLLEANPDHIYFDSAATTHKPKPVLEAMDSFYQHHYGTVHRAVYSLAESSTASYEAVRHQVQRFLGASLPEEIVFTKGTTSALNLVARSYGSLVLGPGDVVLIPEIEHHSNIVPWQMVCKERGAQLLSIPVDERGELRLEEFEKLLQLPVKIVSLAYISNVLGTIHPIETIVKMARRVGAKVCVDAAQAVAHLPINCQALDVDFLAFSGHKLYGPTGIGVLYGKKELLTAMPPIEGGGDMVDRVTLTSSTFQPPPLRFEAGTPPINEVIGLGAALDYVAQLGIGAIGGHENALLKYASEVLQATPGIRIYGTAHQKGAIISFTSDKMHPLDLATLLNLKHVAVRSGHLCSQPALQRFGLTSLCRVSFGVYNSLEEIERFGKILSKILS